MAGNPQLRTTQEGMRTAAQTFEATASGFDQEMARVRSELQALLVTWQGKASSTYGNAFDPWFRSFSKIIADLRGMRQVMTTNATDYVNAEDQSVSAANSLAASLPGV